MVMQPLKLPRQGKILASAQDPLFQWVVLLQDGYVSLIQSKAGSIQLRSWPLQLTVTPSVALRASVTINGTWTLGSFPADPVTGRIKNSGRTHSKMFEDAWGNLFLISDSEIKILPP